LNNSLYKEYVYLLSQNKLPQFLQKYLEVPSLIRLKKVGYFCGMDYASKKFMILKKKSHDRIIPLPLHY